MAAPGFYITTPIYYVNDTPHIGHAYTTILADVLARYQRLAGRPTFFLTGSDEHGQKVQGAAQQAGVTPLEQADRTVARFQALWQKLEISHDDFIRTTQPRHTKVVQDILQSLYDQGQIYQAQYDGGYCVPCERFYSGRDLAAAKCLDCGRDLERISETNYFFRMSAYQDWLIAYIKEHPLFIQPDFRRNETLGFLQKPLNDLCISRPKSRLSWGIELPFDHDFVTYVWFDALVNYISAIGFRADQQRFQQWWPASYHLIGKDILTTHTVYWPSMLKAMGLAMPQTIFAHGWWLLGDAKMSKSSGNVVDPMELAERYGPEPFRYYLMAEMTLGQDCHFSEAAFIRRYNADLANDLGNLLSRLSKLINSHCDGQIPASATATPAEAQLRQAALAGSQALRQAIEQMRLDQGLAALISVVRATNRYLEKRQPWTLAKQKDSRELGTVLYHAAEVLRIVSGLLSPVMPSKMEQLRQALGLPPGAPNWEQLSAWGKLLPGTPLGQPLILFPRLTPAEAPPTPPEPPAPPEPPQPSQPAAAEQPIEYADFMKTQLRTARIVGAAKVVGASKLLKLQIELGSSTRQIVAGIAEHYAPEDLIGKTIVVVANLKPAKIRGELSQGMLLAASQAGQLRLLTLDGDLPSGAEIK